MERLNAKFHADTGQRREGDMIWRVPRRDGQDTYVVLLLEFQSTSDQHMALRVLTYADLLWQQLLREQRLEPGGRLPPILPVVLYNGNAPWLAPVALRGLLALPDRVLTAEVPELEEWGLRLLDAPAIDDVFRHYPA